MAILLEFLNDDIYSMHAREEMLFYHTKENFLLFSRLEQPSISIGRLQSYSDILEDRALNDGVAVTRRKTGGRFMYLDENDVIVSFAFNINGLDKNIAYNLVCRLVIDSLNEIMNDSFHIEHNNDILHISNKKIGGATHNRNHPERPTRFMVHAYIRHRVDLNSLFKYCALDGHPLEDYVNDLAEYITSVSDINPNLTFPKFYSRFYNKLVRQFGNFVEEDVSESQLSNDELKKIQELRHMYTNSEYIHGNSTHQSRGHCDAIAGSGSNSILKIPALVGKVSYE